MKKTFSVVALMLATFCARAQFSTVAYATNPSPGVYNLETLSSCIFSSGAIWSTGPGIDFTKCFSLTFDAEFSSQPVGADGFCVVFGNNITEK